MKVRCQQCENQFEVPVQSAGSISYDGCKNVFRVSYRFRTPCPSCKRILSLAPGSNDEVIGTALDLDENETTESFEVVEESTLPKETIEESTLPKEAIADATLPREEVATVAAPAPTVRITKIKPAPISPTVQTKVQPFRFANQAAKRPTPLHVPVAPRKRGLFPLIKFMFGFLIAGASTATALLIFLALRSGSAPVPVVSPAPEFPRIQTESLVPPAKAEGGPSEKFTSMNPIPPVVIKSVVAAPQEDDTLELPELSSLTSGYGIRLDPFTKRLAFHGGIDFSAEFRAEIKVALPGEVIRTGFLGSYGLVVIVKHADGYETRYAHLDKILVEEGEEIGKGSLIGLAGSTGRSTGVHLHFELLKNGKRLDPLRAHFVSRKTSNS